jgi:hypothetical protein
MQREIVESSFIKSIGYDEALMVLQIEFKEGDVRDYKGVSKELYERFMKSESKGKFYLKNIRKKFVYEQNFSAG